MVEAAQLGTSANFARRRRSGNALEAVGEGAVERAGESFVGRTLQLNQ